MSHPPETPNEQTMAVHADALENIMFLKKQQWSLTNYITILYGAIFGFYHLYGPSISRAIGCSMLTALIMIFGSWLMLLTEESKTKFRRRLANFNQKYFCLEELAFWELRKAPKPFTWDLPFLAAHVAVVVVGAALVLLAISASESELCYH